MSPGATAPLDGLPFGGRHFDGRSARPRQVRFGFDAGDLVLAEGEPLRVPLARVAVSEPLADAPRLFDLPDGSLLQADTDDAALRAALHAAGHRVSPVVRAQRAWPVVLVALLLLVLAFVWAWREGVPRAAEWIADRIPEAAEARMGDQVLATLDRRLLQSSELSVDVQAGLRTRGHEVLRRAGVDSVRRIEFRRTAESDGGVNAFALPGGTVVFLDGLVERLDDDEEALLGILAHEAAHQTHRHMTRGLVRALGYAALAGLVWGDYSSVVTNGAVLVGHLGHSRDAEAEADRTALATLAAGGVSPAGLARFLRLMEVEARQRGQAHPAWLSTHPGLGERAERAERAAEAASATAAASAAAAAASR